MVIYEPERRTAMKLRHIRFFLALAEERDIDRAAARLEVSQSALAMAVAQLERDVGGNLLNREGGDASLTEFGKTMRNQFEVVVANADKALLVANAVAKLDQAELRLGISNTLGLLPLSLLWKSFLNRNPDTRLFLHEAPMTELPALVLSGSVDCGICSNCETLSPKLKVRKLYEERLLLACAKSHPFAALDVIPTERLAFEPYLDRLNCEFRRKGADLLNERGVALRPRIQTDKEEWIQRLIGLGLGVAFLPEFSARSGDIVMRPVQGVNLNRQVQFISASNSPTSIAVDAFERMAADFRWPHS